MRARHTIRNDHPDLVIGLVNNMPKGASRTTEAQFQRLLDLASHRQGVRLKLLTLPVCAPADQDQAPAGAAEPDLAALREIRVDGMIVTGSEPKAGTITDEPLWPAVARLVDWAEQNTISTVWSCLAAHAAVYYIDGLPRQRLPGKLSGVFDCAKASDHCLVRDLPAGWTVPHSRHNGLDEESLARKGYQVLSRSPRVGVDMAVKQGKSLFLMLQGHPEYGAESLSREYRRDVRRYLAGERDSYPDMPESYFDQHTTRTLYALREQATRRRDPALLAALDEAVNALPTSTWGDAAANLYAGWLSYLAEHRPETRVRPGKPQ
jgi:homoserine O-succinyltransferase